MNKLNRFFSYEICFLQILIRLHCWERMHLQEFKTLTGRALYFSMAEAYLSDKAQEVSLKSLSGDVTERSLRNRIKEFECLELLEVRTHLTDERCKRLEPTEQYAVKLLSHVRHLETLCSHSFFLVSKK